MDAADKPPDAFVSEHLDLAWLAIGHVTPSSVRLWVRAPGVSHLVVTLVGGGAQLRVPVSMAGAVDSTRAFTLPEAGELKADTPYEVEVAAAGGAPVARGRFRTAPAQAVERLTFAVGSCHQPFGPDGQLVPESRAMLEALDPLLAAQDARFMLLVGDQVYADRPESRSLFGEFFTRAGPPGKGHVLECSREEVRDLYHRRHRTFLGLDGMRRLLAGRPTYPMLDDHELCDNFGSHPDHATSRWEPLRQGARAAFFDYQVSRVTADGARPTFHYSFVHGPVAVFVMDVRSEKRASEDGARLFDDAQAADLERFLEAQREARVVVIVTSTPVLDIATWVTRALVGLAGENTDVADRWNNPKMLHQRNWLLRLLRRQRRANPAQRHILVSGDIHTGCLLDVKWMDGARGFQQFISSALTNKQPRLVEWTAELIPHTLTDVDVADELEATVAVVDPGAGHRNPYGGLNVGMVDLDLRGEVQVRYRLFGAPRDGGPPPVVFDSGPM